MKLSDWRRENGLTQQQVAEALGCAISTVARYELGSRIPESTPLDVDRDMMKKVFVMTAGAVRPNDFYPIAEWEADLIETEARAELARKAA